MTISLARRQKLAAIAKAHDTWVEQNLAEVSSEFAPVDYPKPGSDYNQHNLDVDASGEAEDELALMLAGVLEAPMTAAGDPDWDESEHPRGPDGKFIEDGVPNAVKDLKQQISDNLLAKNIAYMKGEDYKAQSFHEKAKKLQEQLVDLETAPSVAPKTPVASAPKLSPSASATGGKPITAWTKTIYSGDYADGQVVAVHPVNDERLTWDAGSKKFIWQKKNVTGTWTTGISLSKKSAYEKFKNEKKSWATPTAGALVIDDATHPSTDLFDAGSPGVSPLPTADSGVSGSSPQFKILSRGERGKSGDGYFAGNFWGKYGAAGLMMRNVDDQGVERYLLVQANMKDNPDTFGKWQLPGGAIEELETPEQGAAREVFEELGFDQDFLYNMNQRETHKVTFDVPGFGPWSYSNIAVDVPTMPEPKFDPYELGGAQWFTAAELDKMRKSGQIIKPLEANLDSVLAKFNDDPKVPEPTPIKNQPAPPTAVRPSKDFTTEVAPKAPLNTLVVSQQSAEKTTTWTKANFNTTTAYKTSYEDGEVVGFAKFGSVLTGGESMRIVWENGKFRRQSWTGSGWNFEGSWKTKKDALYAMKSQPFYRPPKGTMADTNNDFISGTNMISGVPKITKTAESAQSIAPTASAVSPMTLKPFNPDGKPFSSYKASFTVHAGAEEAHVGAVHQKPDGTWHASGANGRSPYLKKNDFSTQDDAVAALSAANDAYRAAVSSPVTPVTPVTTKKLPKLTAEKILKQSGVPPKTLKSTQKATFVKNLKEKSPVGFIKADEPDGEKMFTAVVYAVNTHNETESPKLNYLQALNLLDTIYGTKQQQNIIYWLMTSAGKALAPGILAGTGSGKTFPAKSSGITGMQNAYEIGTPKKIHPSYFTAISKIDARDMHEEMYKKVPLSKDQKGAIKDYMSSSNDYNEPLRGNKNMSAWSQKNIALLQSAMRPVTKSFTVWRGTAGLGSAINKQTVKSLEDLKKFEGAVVGDPAFLSTSISHYGKFPGKFTLVVNIPEGTPATYAYASGDGAFEHEQEMLLAAGLHYKIDRVEESYGAYRIYMTVVPEGKKK